MPWAARRMISGMSLRVRAPYQPIILRLASHQPGDLTGAVVLPGAM